MWLVVCCSPGGATASEWGKKFLLLNLSPAVSAVMTWESVFYSVVYILCTVLSIIRACTSIYNVNTMNTYTMLRKKTWKYVCVYVCGGSTWDEKLSGGSALQSTKVLHQNDGKDL